MAQKTGYLAEKLKLFHLSDKRQWTCPYHYHDFDKITLFFRGHVSYDVEGPIIHGDAVYERIIAYISPSYLQGYERRGCPAGQIFTRENAPILRQPQEADNLYNVSCRLRRAWADMGPESPLLQETLFTEFMIHLTRALQKDKLHVVQKGHQNEKIRRILAYIEENLSGDLSISSLAVAFFMSPDYLMHLFKAETGMTAASYITTKRLQKARHLMQEGRALTEICYDCGFTNYSTFYRAWKNHYHTSPKEGIRAFPDTFDE